LTVSPGAIADIADVKPPVMPETDDGAKVKERVPVDTEPPEVLVAVAVRAANTDVDTRAAPPIAAMTIMVSLSAKLPALLLSV
jgi:hypothetical protein